MSLPTLNGRWWLAALVTGAITLAIAACGADDQGGLAPLRVVDDEDSPTVLRIPVGGSVRWSFDGTNTHNVVAADLSWRSEEVVARGGSFERTLRCRPRSRLPSWGRLTVVGGGTAVWVVVLVASLLIGGVV